jgi:hypothetical protein
MLQYQKPTFNTTNVYLVYGNLHFQPLGHIVLISFVAIYKVLSQILCKLVLGLRIMAYVFGWKEETYFLLCKKNMQNYTWAENYNREERKAAWSKVDKSGVEWSEVQWNGEDWSGLGWSGCEWDSEWSRASERGREKGREKWWVGWKDWERVEGRGGGREGQNVGEKVERGERKWRGW